MSALSSRIPAAATDNAVDESGSPVDSWSVTSLRDALPQLGPDVFLTDSGLETELFQPGLDLPEFASFPLLTEREGTVRLQQYFRAHAQVAAESNAGFVLEAATWRASADWGARLGYDTGH